MLLAETARIRETEWQAVCRPDDTTAPPVYPRPWSETDTVDGTDVSAATFDVGNALYDLALEHVALNDLTPKRTAADTTAAQRAGAGPINLHLPDVRDHRGARLWNDLFDSCQQALGLGRDSVHALVRLAGERSCVEIDEILYELREHAIGVVNTVDDKACQERVSATCARRGISLLLPQARSTIATAAA